MGWLSAWKPYEDLHHAGCRVWIGLQKEAENDLEG